MKMLKAAIFDMDGVLVDSYRAWFVTFNKGREHFGFTPISEKEFRKQCWAVSSSVLVPAYFPGFSIPEVTAKNMELFLESMEEIAVMPGVKALLSLLPLKKAVATNTIRAQAERMLAAKGLLGHFDMVVGADDVKRDKPAPDMLLKIVNGFGIRRDEAMFVGDMGLDMDAGKAAGVYTIGMGIDGGDVRIEKIEDVKDIITNKAGGSKQHASQADNTLP
ncbi:TPA: HAD family hydrolase [Candidatus Woesearchaeota archaeon]|nr:HAD family hydrolase [Candidatus Woesearchaeota archaeon]HII69091.1 HAD family hydrolase [Candidatus Woesearchaeota archaeon]